MKCNIIPKNVIFYFDLEDYNKIKNYKWNSNERDKYISNIRSALWDKQLDIQVALESMKNNIRDKNNQNRYVSRLQSPSLRNNISIYDAYRYYCRYYNTLNDQENKSLIVSKSYFEKYVFDNLSQYIIDSKFLSYEWYSI
jgi:hypothetical protein